MKEKIIAWMNTPITWGASLKACGVSLLLTLPIFGWIAYDTWRDYKSINSWNLANLQMVNHNVNEEEET